MAEEISYKLEDVPAKSIPSDEIDETFRSSSIGKSRLSIGDCSISIHQREETSIQSHGRQRAVSSRRRPYSKSFLIDACLRPARSHIYNVRW